jgi:hypothetical protein
MCCTTNRRWLIIPINNSDTAWLVVSDFNQENSLPSEDLRNDILNPDTEQWSPEFPLAFKTPNPFMTNLFMTNFMDLGTHGRVVGSASGNPSELVNEIEILRSNFIGSCYVIGCYVGGSEHDSDKQQRFSMVDRIRPQPGQ